MTPWAAGPEEGTGTILGIAEPGAQGAKSRAGDFKGPLSHLFKDEAFELVPCQRDTQLGREIKLGADGSGIREFGASQGPAVST